MHTPTVEAIRPATDEQPEHAPIRLRAVFAERRLSIGTMDGALRPAKAATFATLVGAAILVALRDVGASRCSSPRSCCWPWDWDTSALRRCSPAAGWRLSRSRA